MVFKRSMAIMLFALMLPLLWVSTEAHGQSTCPGITNGDGWFRFNVQHTDTTAVDSQFTAGLYGSLESTSSGVVGGLDWLYNNASEITSTENSTSTSAESQVATWWTQIDGRSTWVQYTNEATPDTHLSELGATTTPLSVHVQVYGDDCLELINFCDSYTPGDTHIYNLADLTSNAGQAVSTSTLQGNEGFLTITPVVDCGEDDRAIEFAQDLSATVRIIDTVNDVDFGVNAFSRNVGGSCVDTLTTIGGSGAAGVVDGTSCNLDPIEPSVLSQNFSTIGTGPAADVVLFSFRDVYNDADPGIGYQAVPAATAPNFFPDIFDDAENLESCPPVQGCFVRLGVDDALPISEEFTPPVVEEDCAVAGDEDEDGFADCADTDCAGATGPEGQICEPAGEVTCDGVADNDGDGLADADDPDCAPVGDDGGDGGDGGDGNGGGSGCSIATSSSAGTSAAGILLPMMVFGLGIMVRRLRRK